MSSLLRKLAIMLILLKCLTEVTAQRYSAAKRELDDYVEREKQKKNKTVYLRCYQCISHHKDPAPLCDTRYWKLTTLEDRKTMSVDCPADRSAFCGKKIEKVENGYRTFRGCVGPKDIKGRTIRQGCITTVAEIDTLICTCKTDFCNSGNQFRFRVVIFIVTLTLIFL